MGQNLLNYAGKGEEMCSLSIDWCQCCCKYSFALYLCLYEKAVYNEPLSVSSQVFKPPRSQKSTICVPLMTD